jgi:hypothetical protein
MGTGETRAFRAGAAAALLLAGLAAPAAHAESCLEQAGAAVEPASPAKTTYVFAAARRAVNAAGVLWRDRGHHAIRLRGGTSACWSGGAIQGPYPEDAVYECAFEHGYRGGPCWSFHTTAGIAPEVAAPETVIEDLLVSDYGDGVSLEAASGAVIVRRAYLRDLHDDAIENDFAAAVTVADSLIERAFIAFASRPRSGHPIDQRGNVFTIRGNLVLLHRFTHAYKERPGHGGFFKWPDNGSGPRFAVTDNVFVMDDPGRGQLTLPLANQVAECRNNRLLWAGSAGAYRAWLAEDGEHSDGLRSNRARLKALGNCYAVVVKPARQSKAAFLAEHWDPLVARWKAANPAGRAALQTGPSQAPAGTGSDSTGSSSSSQASRKRARRPEGSSRSTVTSPLRSIRSKPAAMEPATPSR